jgi:dipeptidyl aminopeptidase/acylaminoacyl peptidase
VDLASHAERPATDIETVEFTALTAPPRANLRFGANAAVSPSGALVWTDARDPAQQGGRPPLTIVVQSAEEREPVVCAAVECTGQSIKGLWWRNDDEVLFVRGEGVLFQDSALYTWRRGAATPRLVLRTPNLFASSSDWKCAIAQDRLVCFYEEPARPRRLVAINLETGVVETLYDPNPNFARFNLGPPPIRVEFHSPLAGENYGYLVLPPGRRDGERLSLVIVTYRCKGFLRGGIGDEYPIFPFAAQGHAVLCFNVPDLDFARAATMAPDAYTSWARGEGDPEINRVQEGLDAALAQLDRLGVIDPERVGLTGLSYGAETVMYAMFHMPQLAAAIASGTEIGPASCPARPTASMGPRLVG